MVPSYPTLAALACSQLRRSLPTSSNGLRSHRLHTGWFIFRSGRCWWPSSSGGGGVGGQVQQQSCECQGHRPTGAQHCALRLRTQEKPHHHHHHHHHRRRQKVDHSQKCPARARFLSHHRFEIQKHRARLTSHLCPRIFFFIFIQKKKTLTGSGG